MTVAMLIIIMTVNGFTVGELTSTVPSGST